MPNATDNELFMRFVEHDDQEAFDELFTRFEGLPKWIRKKFFVSYETADELAQQTWLKVIQSKHTFSNDKPFKGWLLRAAQNTTLTHIGRETAKPGETSVESMVLPPFEWANDDSCQRPKITAAIHLDFDAVKMNPKCRLALGLILSGQHSITHAAEEAKVSLQLLVNSLCAVKKQRNCEKTLYLAL